MPPPRPPLETAPCRTVWIGLLLLGVFHLAPSALVAAGDLSIEIVAGYNFVVDSNVTSPSTYAPAVATVMARFCNDGDAPLSDVQGFIGDSTALSPGVYPARDSSAAAFQAEHPHLANSGLYALTHLGAVSDAGRYLDILSPAECVSQYWQVTYPRRGNPNNTGPAVWGVASDPDDDLWLEYDVWGTSAESPAPLVASQRATMRNEISANANKIYPQDGQWFNVATDTVAVGTLVTTNGINYDLGNINKGFDNDGDLEYDYNAWLQPVGDPAHDPTCFRLVRTYGTLTIKRSGGDPDLVINFEDQLYFTDLPPDNTGGRGEVHYEFLALRGGCSIGMSPYQEVASGADNEKFTGDYGISLPKIGTYAPEITLEKSVNLVSVAPGGTLLYSIQVDNDAVTPAGDPALGVPLVVTDSIPANTTYVAASAQITLGYTPNTPALILYSTDGRLTWTATEPGDPATVTDLRWWLRDPLPASGSVTPSFEVQVDSPFSGLPFIDNEAELGFGEAPPFARDSTVSLVTGSNSIGDVVWHDADGDKSVDAAETGIASILVELYWDANGDGSLDSSDLLITSAVTNGSGAYSFANLPDGDYIAVVDRADPDLPDGYAPTTRTALAVTDLGGVTTSPYAAADFGFQAGLVITKSLTSSDPAAEGELVTFEIDVTNNRSGTSYVAPADSCVMTRWAESYDAANTTFDLSPADGLGPPDGFSAGVSSLWAGEYRGTGFDWTGGTGTIENVQLVMRVTKVSTLSNDTFHFVYSEDGVATSACPTPNSWTSMPSSSHHQDTLMICDVTALQTWDWAALSDPNFYVSAVMVTAGSSDDANPQLDAIGVRVTKQGCLSGGARRATTFDAAAGTTLEPLVHAVSPSAEIAEKTTSSPVGGIATTISPALPGNELPSVKRSETNLAGSWSNARQNARDFVERRALGGPCQVETWSMEHLIRDNWPPYPGVVSGSPPATLAALDGSYEPAPFGSATYANPQWAVGYLPHNFLKIETFIHFYIDSAVSNDVLNIGLTDGSNLITIDSATLNNHIGVGNAGTIVTDVTSLSFHRISSNNGRYSKIRYYPASVGGNDGVTLYIDAIGIRITLEECSKALSGGTLSPLPLVDTFDADQLQFQWSDPPANSLSFTTTPYANTGVLAWNDLGPLDSRETASVTATFLALEPPDNDGDGENDVATTTNTAATNGAQYLDGFAIADVTASDTVDVAPRGTISGTVFSDDGSGGGTPGNGIRDGAEPGVPGVTVELWSDPNNDGNPSDGVRLVSQQTEADGTYRFDGLADGSYVALVLPATLPGSTFTQTGDPDFVGVCGVCDDRGGAPLANADGLASNDDAVLDFGYTLPNTIFGTVWRDLDGDGVQETGEPGLDSVQVDLKDCGANTICGDGDDGPTVSLNTDSAGQYLFSDLANGSYVVSIISATLPAGGTWNQTGDPDATLDHMTTISVAVAGGQVKGSYDFGYQESGSSTIGDLLWTDWDGDGQVDSGEEGIANVSMLLYEDEDGDGVIESADGLVASTSTNSSGAYLFTGLVAGSYVVVVDEGDPDLPDGYLQSSDPDEPIACNTCDAQGSASVDGSDSVLTMDFGYLPTGSGTIAGVVWTDADRDAIYDAEEASLGGIKVSLYEDDNGNGAVDAEDALIGSLSSDGAGGFRFDSLPGGNYVVDIDTSDTDLPNDSNGNRYILSTQNDPEQVALTAGETRADLEFGFAPPGTIGNSVWRDDDRDALYDLYEIGIANVTVWLYQDTNGDSLYTPGTDVLRGTTTTDAQGEYWFRGLVPDDYIVRVDSSDPDLPSSTLVGDPTETGPCTVCDGVLAVELRAGQLVNFADFGFQAPGSIGNAVWLDSNGDGLYSVSSELGLANVQLNLVDASLSVVASTTTDSEGFYAFGDIADGNYTVAVVTASLPASVVLFYDPDEGAGCTVCDHVGSVSIASGSVDYTIDFGYQVGASSQLSITKSSSAGGGPVNPGSVINYNVTVLNSGALPVTEVSISDPLPNGTTYVPGSAQLSGMIVGTGDYRDEFTATYPDPGYNGSDGTLDWSPNAWSEINDDGSPSGGDVQVLTDSGDLSLGIQKSGRGAQRGFDLTGSTAATISLDYRRAGFDGASDYVTLDISYNGGSSWTELTRFAGPATDSAYQNFSIALDPATYLDSNPADNLLRLLSSGLANNGSDDFYADSITIDVTSRALRTVGAQAPALMVPPGPDVYLLSGESLSLTFQVVVDDPLSSAVSQITNRAGASSRETIEPIFAMTIDRVSRGGIIGDRVWHDVDGDGSQDVGEPGLANVTVLLTDPGGDGQPGGGDDTVVGLATTDINGSYRFSALSPGVYFVDVTDATVPGALSLTAGGSDPSSVRTVTANETFLDLDFGYTNTSTTRAVIGDRIWSDADADGLQDPSEAGLGGVTVQLLNEAGTVVLTTTTAADGFYLFDDVVPGSYSVEVAASNFSAGQVLSGYSVTSGPQSPGTDQSAPIVVEAGDAHLDADFGYDSAATRSITDRVWFDANADTFVDIGERGLEGVTFSLLDSHGDVVASTVSDGSGFFTFTGLAPGSYVLQVTDVHAQLLGLTGTTTAALNSRLPLSVTTGNLSGASFGYNVPGAIGDMVWSDVDADGVLDPDEVGIANVTVNLWRDADANGVFDMLLDTPLLSTVTDGAGYYRFESLAAGTYFASIDGSQAALTGYTATTADQELGANAPGIQIEATLISVLAGYLDADFGFQNAVLADVSGTIFDDRDRDGVNDGAGEPGIAGVTLALEDMSGNVLATTISDASGAYAFRDLAAGNYRVVVTDDDDVLADAQLTSGLDALPVALGATNVGDVDFGYNRTQERGTIGDTVWFDANRDGVMSGAENGLSGVVVELWEDSNGDGLRGAGDTLLETTTTDLAGSYLFSGLAPGNYFVDPDESTLPAGFGATPGTGPASPMVALAAGTDDDTADFGYAPTVGSALGDTVFFDADGDGIQDPGELGIAGVDVTVTGPGGYNVTVTTDAYGNYLATGISTTGVYNVSVDTSKLPAGLDPNPTSFPLAAMNFAVDAGTDWLFADFGFQETVPGTGFATIGDLVFLDANGNGSRDAGESGIGGVSLSLFDSGGSLLATTMTAADGRYSFSGLAAGDYTVEVTDTVGLLVGFNLSAGSNPTATITVVAGDNHDSADFGYAPGAGLGTIGNLVWHDKNGDGSHDPGEPGIEGVTVALWLDSNNNSTVEPGVDNLVREAITDRNGEYYFLALPPEDYLASVSDERLVLEGLSRTQGVTQTDGESQADPYAVTLSPGVRAPSDFTADFGFTVSSTSYKIVGTVFEDGNANGVLNGGEAGVGGAVLSLYRDLDGDGVLDLTDPFFGAVTSLANGTYAFIGLPGSSDWLIVSDLSGTSISGAEQTTQLATAGVQPVSIAAVDPPPQDFGYARPVTRALLASVSASSLGDSTVLEWSTASEEGTLGFIVSRFSTALGWVPVHEGVLPAEVFAPAGATYRLLDHDATASEPQLYLLEEVELSGATRHLGVFEVRADTRAAAIGAAFESIPNAPTKSPLSPPAARALLPAAISGPRAHIGVSRDGIHFLSTQEVASAMTISRDAAASLIASQGLRLSRAGEEIPWWSLDGSGLSFYAFGAPSLFHSGSVYQLERRLGIEVTERVAEAGAREVAAPAVLSPLRFENDVFPATAAARDPEREFWFWSVHGTSHSSLLEKTLILELPHYVPEALSTVIEVDVFGATDGLEVMDHGLSLQVDGVPVGTVSFPGREHRTLRFEVPPGVISASTIRLDLVAVAMPGVSRSIFYVDGLTVSYPRRPILDGSGRLRFFGGDSLVEVTGLGNGGGVMLDVTDPSQPMVILPTAGDDGAAGSSIVFWSDSTRTYEVTARDSLLRPSLVRPAATATRLDAYAAEYLIIAPLALMDAGDALADYRATWSGLSTSVVPVEAIYDAFSYGEANPWAVREFLRRAFDRWSTVPRYVVLLGRGSMDYRDALQNGDNLLPPALVATPHGLYASDSALADLTTSPGLEVAIGRIPISNAAELSAYLEKVEWFERSAGDPAGTISFLSDNPDYAGDFPRDSSLMSSIVPADLSVNEISLSSLSLTEARAQTRQSFASGSVLMNFLGHGGLDRLAAEGLLTVADVSDLQTGPLFPVVSALTCSAGRFEVPQYVSLAEKLTLEPRRGAVAVLAPSGLSVHDEAVELGRQLLAQVLAGKPQRLGDVWLHSLGTIAPQTRFDDLAKIYHLIGDPALELPSLGNSTSPEILFADDFEGGGVGAWDNTSR